ncbi:MAG: hypothetical protein MJ249_04045 [Kiritimatiellae bacterium]|nr:hypothetical protein [Kiritimatiellia bacterium]
MRASVEKRTFFSCTVVSTLTLSKSLLLATLLRTADATDSFSISMTPVSPTRVRRYAYTMSKST